ncbi:MAG TPA: EamA family transporter [Caulobacteraceae bacterium]|nr:EamA family transporter [Caulobacteraceae bacterium]
MTKTGAIGLALASAALFGASTPAAKLLLGVISPWMLAGLLYVGSGLGLGATVLIRRWTGSQTQAPLRGADLPWLAGAVVFGGLVGPVLLMLGLSVTPASSAALLLNLEGLATMAIAWIVFRENVDRRLLLGALAILAGAAILSWSGATLGALPVGALLIAGACLAWGVDNNLTRKISGADPMVIAATKGLVAGPISLAIGLMQGAAAPAPTAMAGAAVVGLLGSGVSLVCFILALRHLGAARTGAYFSTAPFVGAVLGVVFLAEPLTLWLALAAGLMALGVWLHLTEVHAHEHAHETLEHEHAHVHDEHHRHDHAPGDPAGEPHTHRHRHAPLIHSHPHYPDLHHRHGH